jgi:hypothetical protein
LEIGVLIQLLWCKVLSFFFGFYPSSHRQQGSVRQGKKLLLIFIFPPIYSEGGLLADGRTDQEVSQRQPEQ